MVEGALLGDIAIVFLLMRAFIPLPGVRQLLRAVATVPFVMLTQRRGIKLTILASLAAYILLSALIGPLLALAALDVAVAGILAGAGRKFGLGIATNTLVTGPLYAFFDLFLPTIASIYIFRYPIKKIVEAAKNFIKLVFNFVVYVLNRAHVSRVTIHHVDQAKAWATAHWVVPWFGSLVLLGLLTMYLAVLVSEMVLRQIPDETLESQRAVA
ncbi:MAG: hypothetical protein ACRDFX_02260 [Chloroflexota bacterium]